MTPKPTPEQRAALDRAKKQPTHPYRAWHGTGGQRDRDPQQVVPFHGRLVRA